MFTHTKPEQIKDTKRATHEKNAEKSGYALNLTATSDVMKSRNGNLSGFSFDDVRVHFSSDKPAQLQALSHMHGNEVYTAPKQEKHWEYEDCALPQIIQRRLFISGHEYTDKGENDQETVRQYNIRYIEGLYGDQLTRALSMARFDKEYRFTDATAFREWITTSVNVSILANTIHLALHAHIKSLMTNREDNKDTVSTPTEGDKTWIAGPLMSTTGVLVKPDEGIIEIANNYGIFRKQADKNWKAEGYPITMDMIVASLHGLTYNGVTILENYTIKLITQPAALTATPFVAPPTTDDGLAAGLIARAKNSAQQVIIKLIAAASKEPQWQNLNMHADTMLVHSASGVQNPLIGISKAPCEMCALSGVLGRPTDAGTGLGGNTIIQVAKTNNLNIGSIVNTGDKTNTQASINAGKAIVEEVLFALYRGKATCVNEGDALRITLPKWIPQEWITLASQTRIPGPG